MLKQGHVGNLEMFVLISIYTSVLYFYSLPAILGEKVATGAWILNILLGVGGFLFFLPLGFLLKRFPGRSIVEIAGDVLSGPGRISVMVAIASFYLLEAAMFARTLAGSLTTTVLPHTPTSANLAMIFIVGGMLSYVGFEAITRTALIFSPFILGGMLLIAFLVLPDVNTTALYPLLGASLQQHAVAAFQFTPVVHEVLFVGVVAPYLRQGRSPLGTVFWALALATVVTTFVVIVIELSFPFPGFEFVPYPMLQVAKMVRIGRFIERIEALFLIMALVAILIQFSMVLHNGILSLAQGLKLADWRPLIFPWVIIGYALAFIPHSGRDVEFFVYSIWNGIIFLSVGTLLPLALYLMALIRGKKGAVTVGKSN
ncbi:MAG: GerAB/ArcD/ProY family transporter [Peptococcaceae bacterium]|nr:GerAB/ArcD/ProY family transporter [Peptococcaceae bacterium]